MQGVCKPNHNRQQGPWREGYIKVLPHDPSHTVAFQLQLHLPWLKKHYILGTRGLLGHIIRSKNLRKGVYNHFDSYPTGLGSYLAKFINGLTDEQIQKMVEMVAKMSWIEDERSPAPDAVQARYAAFGFADTGVGSQNASDWYCLLRNVQGAAALPHILDGTLTHLVDSTDFEQDGLFCEWSYFIDWEGREVQIVGGGKEGTVGFAELSPEWMRDFEKKCHENGGDDG